MSPEGGAVRIGQRPPGCPVVESVGGRLNPHAAAEKIGEQGGGAHMTPSSKPSPSPAPPSPPSTTRQRDKPSAARVSAPLDDATRSGGVASFLARKSAFGADCRVVASAEGGEAG